MLNGLFAATVPSNGQARPIRFCDGATVGLIVLPANAGADFEKSGLVAGHRVHRSRPATDDRENPTEAPLR